MRGKGHARIDCAAFVGITPACAGKRSVKDLGAGELWDHPRVCGEKHDVVLSQSFYLGSPPRVRGKEFSTAAGVTMAGITPACAGKSQSHSQGSAGKGDHPRVCGEKIAAPRGHQAVAGSPPRMRGKESFEEHGFVIGGITPACAGKSPPDIVGELRSQDHPRVCGEKLSRHLPQVHPTGSPPRVRGKVILRFHDVSGLGITPACAGKRFPD